MHIVFRRLAALWAGGAVCLAPLPAVAAGGAFLGGRVLDANARPVAGATVTVRGGNLILRTATRADGGYVFTTLPNGEYQLHAESGALVADGDAQLTGDGASVPLRLHAPNEIGAVVVAAPPAPVRGSGTDVRVTGGNLAHSPSSRRLPDILLQLPTAARGSNGQVHVNGDHNGINYVIDGVALPPGLNRVLGSEIDPSVIGSMEVLTGAYPAEYGDRFAAVLDISTAAQSGPASSSATVEAGSYGSLDTNVGYHAPLARGGGVSVAVRNQSSNRGIDPAVPDFTHGAASNGTQVVRLTLPMRGADTLNANLIHANQTFQVPPDTNNGVPPETDVSERQNDIFLSVRYRHDINGRGSFAFGPSLKISRILDGNDPARDFAGAGGGATPACTDFSDCDRLSVRADRRATTLRFNGDYALRSDKHEVRAGFLYGGTTVAKNSSIGIGPTSQLNPTGVFAALDTDTNRARQQSLYLQDRWNLSDRYSLDYGMRVDALQFSAPAVDNGFSQWSPRVKLTRVFTPRANVYAYYGRLFSPFSFETVAPRTAASLFTTADAPGTAFDLKPQRDSLYEIGGHVPLGRGQLGVRVSHKVSTDYLDDTQVGATNLHQDINFPQGRVDVAALTYQHPLPRQGRAYLSVATSHAVNSANCETQLLQNCAAGGPPGGDWVASDHDQRWTISGGVLLNEARGGWFSLDGEYGSGLSAPADRCSDQNPVTCKVPPHLTFNAQKGVALSKDSSVALTLRNLLNDRYAITLDNALQGTHYAEPRTVLLQARFNR